MTILDLLERGRAAARWRWTPVIAVALLAAVLVQRLDAGRRAEHEARRLAEAAELEAQGQIVASLRSRAELQASARRLAAENADLAEALKTAQRAAPGARPVMVVEASTGPVPAAGAARPSPPSGGPAPAPATCLLAAGDRGEVRVDSVLLQTRAGNLVFVGAASAWRLEPGPPARLFGGQLTAKVAAEAPERPAGWGFGAAVIAGRAGWMVGPTAASPPLRLWRYQGEAQIGALAGPGGEWAGTASFVVRRWR